MTLICQGLLFDLDGVLVDSTAAVARVWRQWAVEHSLDPQLVVDLALGRRSLETIQLVAPHLDAEAENLKVEEMEIADKAGVIALPGAAALLPGLPQDRFTLVTSATPILAVARLGYADLPVPRRFVSADDVTQGKPFPDPYLKGAAVLGLPAADCVAFEDTPAGIESARAAGMRVIALHTTYPARELEAADLVVASLADVRVEVGERNLAVHTNLPRRRNHASETKSHR